MQIRFKLDYLQKEKAQSLFMLLTFGRKSAMKIVVQGIKLFPSQWNSKQQKVRDLKEIKNRHEINDLISKMRRTAEKVIIDIQKQEPPLTYEKVENKIREIYPRVRNNKTEQKEETEVTAKTTFLEFAEIHLKELTTKTNENGKLISEQTIKNDKSAITGVKEFAESKGIVLDFSTFSVAFLKEYKAYLTIEKGYKANYIDKRVSTLYKILDIAHERDLHENLAYKKKEVKTKSVEVDNVYLTEKELDQIESYDFTNNERLDNVRDWFLIACWTGLRFSDLSKLKREFIRENKIVIEQQKTGQKVTISLSITETIPKILNKRNGDFPKLVSNQKFNQYVKEMLELVGINEPTKIYETKAGNRISIEKPKYEFVTAHTARRTFATNLYLRKVPISTIMAATGHRTEQEFMKYIKASQDERVKGLDSYMKQ